MQPTVSGWSFNRFLLYRVANRISTYRVALPFSASLLIRTAACETSAFTGLSRALEAAIDVRISRPVQRAARWSRICEDPVTECAAVRRAARAGQESAVELPIEAGCVREVGAFKRKENSLSDLGHPANRTRSERNAGARLIADH